MEELTNQVPAEVVAETQPDPALTLELMAEVDDMVYIYHGRKVVQRRIMEIHVKIDHDGSDIRYKLDKVSKMVPADRAFKSREQMALALVEQLSE